MRELLEKAVEKFNEKARTDEKLQKELEGVERTLLIDLKDGAKFNLVLKEKQIGAINEGAIESPNITIISDEATLTALLKGEMGPMKAYATQKLKVKASLEDLLRIRKFF